MKEELIPYVQDRLVRGASRALIKESLLSQGMPSSEADELIAVAAMRQSASDSRGRITMFKNNWRAAAIGMPIAGILLFISTNLYDHAHEVRSIGWMNIALWISRAAIVLGIWCIWRSFLKPAFWKKHIR